MVRAVVLFSGGQDSTTCLHWAIREYGANGIRAVSVVYGQRHVAETEAAAEICGRLGIAHELLDCEALGQIADSALVSGGEILPSGGRGDREMAGGLPTSFVPGRNLILLTLAAAVAVKHGAGVVVTGVCQADYSGYPDCRRAFVDSLEETLRQALPSSVGGIHIQTPLMDLSKAESVRLARNLPGCWESLSRSVTCYLGRHPGCGQCPSCILRAKGFADAGESDPATVEKL